MITNTNIFVKKYNVEERSNETIENEIEFVESFFSKYYPLSYSLWNADTTEATYSSERKYIKDVVYNLTLANLLLKPTISTSFGSVRKIDDYSQQQDYERIINESVRYVNKAMVIYNNMMNDTNVQWATSENIENHIVELYDYQNALENYYCKK